MHNYLLPSVTSKQKDKFQHRMSIHLYATGESFQRIEDCHLGSAVAVLRPDPNLLPNRKKLASMLLDKCYTDIKGRVDDRLAKVVVCITMDGWTNIKNYPVVNYMLTSPEFSIFLESISTGQQGHDALWIAGEIRRVLSAYSYTLFSGAVTDNTYANKNAWQILSKKFPTKYFQGCCSHGLHLLVKDIFAVRKTKEPGSSEPSYPIYYPFEDILEFVEDCKEVIKFFHNHHVVKAQLQEAQNVAGVQLLARAAPTRWGTIKDMCKTMLSMGLSLHGTLLGALPRKSILD